MTQFLSNRDIYTSVICDLVPQARERLWIATAAHAAKRREARAASLRSARTLGWQRIISQIAYRISA